ncbi:MAG: GNAT family N-acetyltransferase [Clostridia bacterium]|nr:GNAT family N-acetyltransferase [Clostridia bacterium]
MGEIKTVILGIESEEKLIEFNKLCFPTDFWKKEDWDELLADPRAIYYALLDDGELVGNVFIYNWQGEADYVKIMNLSVRPDHRGAGLAHRLLDHVTSEMNKLGMKRFCGETRASNTAMQKVFEDCGYRLDRIEEGAFDNPSESAYKYVLEIT